MRVLHVLSDADPRHGGPVTALCGLAAAQVRIGMDVSVLSTFRAHSNVSAVQRLGLESVDVRLTGPTRGPLDRSRDLAKSVEAAVAGASVVHIHGLWQDIQYLAATQAISHRVPYVVRPCGMLSPWSLAQSRLRKRLYHIWRLGRMLKGAAAIHFTGAAEESMAAPLRLPAVSIVEPNGIDLSQFDTLPPRGNFRRRYGISDEQQIVLFLGRLHYKKGLDLLIQAFAAAETPSLLVLAGPDSNGMRHQLETLSLERGLEGRFLFTGMLEPPRRTEALVDADIFVLPSYNENFGLAVAESLAAGLPVIVSDQVGLSSDVTAAGAGSVVPCKVEPLAAEIRRWLQEPSLRTDAGENGRRYALSQFDWTSIASRWLVHYTNLRQAIPQKPSGSDRRHPESAPAN